jgi:hypothetical protein
MASAHNRWVVPFGGGIGKITRVGKQPVVWQVNLYYNLIRPQWGFRGKMNAIPG